MRISLIAAATCLLFAACQEVEPPAPLAPVDIQASLTSSSFVPGEILVSEWSGGQIRRIAADGSASSVFYSGMTRPNALRLESTGDVVVAESIGILRRILDDGSSSSVIRSGLGPTGGVAIADNGDIIVTQDGPDYQLRRITPDGSSTTLLASGIKSEDVEVDSDGNFIVLQELEGGKILRVTPGGVVTTVFCCLSAPADIVIEPSGDFLVAEFGAGRIARVAADGSSSQVIYTGLNKVEGIEIAADGDLLVTEFGLGRITRIAPDGSSSSVFFTGLSGPDHLIVISALQVAIDIKPGSYPNCVNPASKGRLPVAVLSEDDFDAPTVVDPATVLLEDAAPLRWADNKDVSGDGLLDLVFHFATQDLAGFLTHGNELELTGNLYDGTPIVGTDAVYEAGQPPCLD